MNFGGFIKNRRIQLNLTQAEISSFLHITLQGLSNYENGKTKVPLSLVLDLCASLNLDINDLFLLKENAPNSNPDLTDYNFDNILWLVRLFEGEFITLFDDFFFKYFEDAPRL